MIDCPWHSTISMLPEYRWLRDSSKRRGNSPVPDWVTARMIHIRRSKRFVQTKVQDLNQFLQLSRSDHLGIEGQRSGGRIRTCSVATARERHLNQTRATGRQCRCPLRFNQCLRPIHNAHFTASGSMTETIHLNQFQRLGRLILEHAQKNYLNLTNQSIREVRVLFP